MSMWCAKNKNILGKNPVQIIALTIYKQAHNLKMHENMIIMPKSAMHDHLRTEQQNPTQNF